MIGFTDPSQLRWKTELEKLSITTWYNNYQFWIRNSSKITVTIIKITELNWIETMPNHQNSTIFWSNDLWEDQQLLIIKKKSIFAYHEQTDFNHMVNCKISRSKIETWMNRSIFIFNSQWWKSGNIMKYSFVHKTKIICWIMIELRFTMIQSYGKLRESIPLPIMNTQISITSQIAE